MDLDAARNLKSRIRDATDSRLATGIAMTERAGEYNVALLLSTERDLHFLESPRMRRILDRESRHVRVEVSGIARPPSSPATRTAAEAVLKIGSSVGHARGGVGSLGFFAARRSDGARGLVSCNHVIAMADGASHGDAVVSPSTLDGDARVVASLDGRYPRLASAAVADCAFAVLDEHVPYDSSSVAGGLLHREPAVVAERADVTKVGRMTGATHGVVMHIEVDGIRMRYGATTIAFNDVIQIGAASGNRFCYYGDSGALVYTSRSLQPVGLLFATSFIGGPHNMGWSWVHPMSQVLDALRVDFIQA